MNKKCEGMRRRGGAFTLGPPRWEACKEEATVLLVVEQDGHHEKVPACHTCWDEAISNNNITVVSAIPIVKKE